MKKTGRSVFFHFVSLRVGELQVSGGRDGLDTGTGLVSVWLPCTTSSDQRAQQVVLPTWVPLQVGGRGLGVDVDVLHPVPQLDWRPEVVALLSRPGLTPEVGIEGSRLYRGVGIPELSPA